MCHGPTASRCHKFSKKLFAEKRLTKGKGELVKTVVLQNPSLIRLMRDRDSSASCGTRNRNPMHTHVSRECPTLPKMLKPKRTQKYRFAAQQSCLFKPLVLSCQELRTFRKLWHVYFVTNAPRELNIPQSRIIP